MNIDLVFLSFNEVDGLRFYAPRTPEKCREHRVANCWAVDGGSVDGSLDVYRVHQIPVLIQDKKGRGEAFKLAFEKSRADALIFFSPDGNEDIGDIPLFIRYLEEGADMVIASRMMKGARNEEDDQILKCRKWVNQLFTLAANLLWNRSGRYVTDTINGFRAIRRSAWESLNVTASDYTVEYQTTIHAFKLKCRVVEFPTREGRRIGGVSYARSWPTGWRFLKLLMREVCCGKRLG